MYEVEAEAGRMDPLPDYFTDWPLARWMGVTVDAMRDMPVRDVEAARQVMTAQHQAEADAHKQQAGRKGRRR